MFNTAQVEKIFITPSPSAAAVILANKRHQRDCYVYANTKYSSFLILNTNSFRHKHL